MNDILTFLKETRDDSEVFQFIKEKTKGSANAIGSRAKTTIKTQIKTLREPHIYNWKFVMIIGIIVSLLIFGFFVYITPIVEARFPNPLFKEIYGLYLFLIFFNLANAVYTITYYYYRLSVIGMKGPRGKTGMRGETGKNTACQIDKKYTSTFIMDEKPIKRELKTRLNLPPSLLQKDNKDGWKVMEGTLGIRRFLSGNGRKCSTLPTNSPFHCELTGKTNTTESIFVKDGINNQKTNQPFNGVILDVDEKNEIIYSIQFFYDKNLSPTSTVEYTLLDKRYGSSKTKGKVYTLLCPINTAFYKVEVLVSEDRENISNKLTDFTLIRGVAFQCRDITTGDLKPLRMPDGSSSNRVFYGRNPSPADKLYRYITSECGYVMSNDSERKLKLPGFFSGLSVLSSSSAVHGLRMDQCSYYFSDPSKY